MTLGVYTHTCAPAEWLALDLQTQWEDVSAKRYQALADL